MNVAELRFNAQSFSIRANKGWNKATVTQPMELEIFHYTPSRRAFQTHCMKVRIEEGDMKGKSATKCVSPLDAEQYKAFKKGQQVLVDIDKGMLPAVAGWYIVRNIKDNNVEPPQVKSERKPRGPGSSGGF